MTKDSQSMPKQTNQPSPLGHGTKCKSDQAFRSVDHCIVPERNNQDFTISWYRTFTFLFFWWLWLPLAVGIRVLEGLGSFSWLLFVLNKVFDIVASLFGIEYYEYEIQDFAKMVKERNQFYNMKHASRSPIPDKIKGVFWAQGNDHGGTFFFLDEVACVYDQTEHVMVGQLWNPAFCVFEGIKAKLQPFLTASQRYEHIFQWSQSVRPDRAEINCVSSLWNNALGIPLTGFSHHNLAMDMYEHPESNDGRHWIRETYSERINEILSRLGVGNLATGSHYYKLKRLYKNGRIDDRYMEECLACYKAKYGNIAGPRKKIYLWTVDGKGFSLGRR